MRIMGIDYGDQRIGLALSDESAILCGRAWTLNEWNLDRAVARIAEEARANAVGLLVLGLPKNMDGTEGPRAEKSRMVAQRLHEATGLEVVLWDERRSSIEAHGLRPACAGAVSAAARRLRRARQHARRAALARCVRTAFGGGRPRRNRLRDGALSQGVRRLHPDAARVQRGVFGILSRGQRHSGRREHPRPARGLCRDRNQHAAHQPPVGAHPRGRSRRMEGTEQQMKNRALDKSGRSSNVRTDSFHSASG